MLQLLVKLRCCFEAERRIGDTMKLEVESRLPTNIDNEDLFFGRVIRSSLCPWVGLLESKRLCPANSSTGQFFAVEKEEKQRRGMVVECKSNFVDSRMQGCTIN